METTSIPQPTITDLVPIWQGELTAIADLCETLTATQWSAQTHLPGWTVADVAAHLVDIEQLLAGSPRPDHEPDWDALPHATGRVSRFTEIGVDARRGRRQAAVIAELRAVIPPRRSQLDRTPPTTPVPGPFGKDMPVEQLVRMRIFDSWVHEQDIRSAARIDGGWNSDAAGIALSQILLALPYIWARNAKAPTGGTLRVVIVGHDARHDVGVGVDEAGKGVSIAPPSDADVQLEIGWEALVLLACGRIGADDPSLENRLELRGDPELGRALLQGMTITP